MSKKKLSIYYFLHLLLKMTRRGRGGFNKGMDEKKYLFYIILFGSLGLSSLNNCSLSLCTGHWTEQKELVQEAVQEFCTVQVQVQKEGARVQQFGTFSESKFKKSLGRCP